MQVVVLPGLDGTGRLQRRFCVAVGQATTVQQVAYPATVVTYAEAVAHVREMLPKTPFILVAESYSGPVAAMLAAQAPNGLRGVVYVASFARRPRVAPSWAAYALRMAPVRSGWALRFVRPLLIGRWAGAAFLTDLQKSLADVPASVLAGRLRAVLRVDVRAALQSITVPQMYLRASADRLVPARAADDFAKAGCDIMTVEGPHFLTEGNAQAVAEATVTFLRSLDQS